MIRVHPIRHDRSKEHAAFGTPAASGKAGPAAGQDAPPGPGVKAEAAARSA